MLHISACCRVCLIRDSGGIGTQISDQTNGTMPLYIYTFIKLLGNPLMATEGFSANTSFIRYRSFRKKLAARHGSKYMTAM